MENKRNLNGEPESVDRQGQHIHLKKQGLAYLTKQGLLPIGKAYAFFDCNAPKEEIENELPFIRECVPTPNELELSLMEGMNEDFTNIARSAVEGDSFNHEYNLVTNAIKNGENLQENFSRFVRLVNRIDICNGDGARYALEATYPKATNLQTADELASILNQAYQSPLYQKGEEFRGEIVYKEGEKYIFRE